MALSGFLTFIELLFETMWSFKGHRKKGFASKLHGHTLFEARPTRSLYGQSFPGTAYRTKNRSTPKDGFHVTRPTEKGQGRTAQVQKGETHPTERGKTLQTARAGQNVATKL